MLTRILLQSLLLLALAAVAGALVYRFHPDRPELYLTQETAAPGEITAAEAKARAAAGPVLWLDARQEREFQAGHIPGALLLNEYDWENLLIAAFPAITEAAEGTPVIIYCDGQQCAASRAVREKLRQTPLGDRELLILRGGWPAWQATGS
jgi:rhodanese-related sulfurtransferase